MYWEPPRPLHSPKALQSQLIWKRWECRFPEWEIKSGCTRLIQLTTHTHSILVCFPAYLLSSPNKITDTHAHTHTHANTSSLPPHKHFLSHLTQVLTGLTDCLHMQQHVLRMSCSSSKQIATTQTENMYSALSSSLQSLAGLFTVFPHWEGKNALFCHIFLSPRLQLCLPCDKTLLLSQGTRFCKWKRCRLHVCDVVIHVRQTCEENQAEPGRLDILLLWIITQLHEYQTNLNVTFSRCFTNLDWFVCSYC